MAGVSAARTAGRQIWGVSERNGAVERAAPRRDSRVRVLRGRLKTSGIPNDSVSKISNWQAQGAHDSVASGRNTRGGGCGKGLSAGRCRAANGSREKRGENGISSKTTTGRCTAKCLTSILWLFKRDLDLLQQCSASMSPTKKRCLKGTSGSCLICSCGLSPTQG
jgi:hypothetical protein